jgi:RNA polymerase sigma-70 factor (ECF subfamily)
MSPSSAGPSSADLEWFEREVVDALPDLFGAALRLTRNRADAEDLVADAIAKGWSKLDTLTDRTRVRGWLFRILTNAFISAKRTDTRRGPHDSIDEDPGDRGFSLFDQLHVPVLLLWGNPEQEFLDKVLREDLQRAVDALPERYRLVLVLADMQGCAYQEIADTLGIPLGTVRSRLARARGLVQRALWRHAQELGLVDATSPTQTLDHD